MPRCGYCNNDCSPTAKVCPRCGDDLGASQRPWERMEKGETIFDKSVKYLIIGCMVIFFFITLALGG